MNITIAFTRTAEERHSCLALLLAPGDAKRSTDIEDALRGHGWGIDYAAGNVASLCVNRG